MCNFGTEMVKKIILLIILTSVFTNLYSQTDYFEGKRTYCEFPDNERIKEIFPLGIKCIQDNLYLGTALEIFSDVIKIDPTFCDAYFWAGYTFRLHNMNKEAVAMYYIADSLAQNKSIEFKQNLTSVSMLIGADSLARKKFEEIKEYFPSSPEGFYGVALSSTIIGDVGYGLENINIAEKKYRIENKDVQFLKAILLTLNEKYVESLSYYKKIKNKFNKHDHFNGSYALSLYEIAIKNNDDKMLKLARKHYNRVKNKDELTENMRSKFEK
jgi:tetratricopeptide (TPR) repeat protein